MGRGEDARRFDRGGEIVQAPPGTGARVVAAAGALASAAGLVLYAAIAAERLGLLLFGIGAAGWAALLLSLTARAAVGVPWALALLGGEYAGYLSLARPGLASGAVYAGAFLLVAELAFRALEPVGVRDDAELVARRLASALALGAGAAGLGALLLAFSNVEVARGFWLEALGVLAAVATLAAVAWLAHTRG